MTEHRLPKSDLVLLGLAAAFLTGAYHWLGNAAFAQAQRAPCEAIQYRIGNACSPPGVNCDCYNNVCLLSCRTAGCPTVFLVQGSGTQWVEGWLYDLNCANFSYYVGCCPRNAEIWCLWNWHCPDNGTCLPGYFGRFTCGGGIINDVINETCDRG